MDHTKKERLYMQTYALDTMKGVEKILRDRQRIASRRFRGDTDASDIILDLNMAIDRAKLSQRQAEVILFRYRCDMTQDQTAEQMNVSRQAVQQLNALACRRIARVFREWKYGEVRVEMEAEEGSEVVA